MQHRLHKVETSKAATNEASKSSKPDKAIKDYVNPNKKSDKVNIANNNLPVIAGVEITTDSEGRFNLNALHKASGGDNAKRPSLWLSNKQAQELAEELSRNSCLGQEVIKTVRGGINPGTFAHELLAVEYAGWISPKFRLQVNQTFIDYRSGKLAPASPEKSKSGLPEYRRARTLKMSVDAVSSLFALMPNLSNEAKQCAAANIVNPIVGFEAVPLPALEEKYYTAGEVGKMLEVSANKIGRVANGHNLKNKQHGKFFLDKSAHSDKQVEAFRYNENGIKALRHLIHGVEVA
ncbi:KilA-N domain-containing protein [Xenorhabdus bovienii]|uniref:KilA-N domain-containing protein n=1 Tax=Xenorhabdus bovienii TaxID=40576 RepID=UPI0023B2A6C2|nr:KilA-N domain-containing protein [Xenorhabdus bovienii]MDE9495696.1 KilA-N domain-containing protein [Xenorhabdus bovienii]MDE9504099.1 KilA-N domain-containing protein [Xenorhabdus bovienii]